MRCSSHSKPSHALENETPAQPGRRQSKWLHAQTEWRDSCPLGQRPLGVSRLGLRSGRGPPRPSTFPKAHGERGAVANLRSWTGACSYTPRWHLHPIPKIRPQRKRAREWACAWEGLELANKLSHWAWQQLSRISLTHFGLQRPLDPNRPGSAAFI